MVLAEGEGNSPPMRLFSDFEIWVVGAEGD